MKRQGLPKAHLLRKSRQYQEVYAKGSRLHGQRFSLICLVSGQEYSRLGISIHGIRSAVRRNRIKRIIREFFRLHREQLAPAADLVFAVRPGFDLDSPAEIREAVRKVLAKSPRSPVHWRERPAGCGVDSSGC